MARIKGNFILQSVSGKLGPFVVRQYRTGTVLAVCPRKSNVKPTERQKEARQRFKAAAVYAKSVLNDPEKKEALRSRVKKNSNLFTAAVAEYLKSKKEHGEMKPQARHEHPPQEYSSKPSYLLSLWVKIKGENV